MRLSLKATALRVSIFVIICVIGFVAVWAVFGDVRFEKQTKFNAVFTNVSGLKGNNFVRIAGVEVGKVKKITVRDDGMVNVEFAVDNSVVLTEGTRALIRYQNLVGDRYLALEDGPGGVKPLTPGQTIPPPRTQPALDLDALIGGFRPLLNALDPDQVNALTGQLIQAFQGQGVVVGSILDQTAALTSTLADRDQLVGQVIINLSKVLGSLGDQSGQLDSTVDTLADLVEGLADRKTDIANGLANINAAAGSITDLLSRARPPLQRTVDQADRVANIIMADHAYFDNLLNTLPDKYQILSRLGMHGDFFSFYLCEVFLKLNGKGGQPVYVKVAGQSSGRCTQK